MKDYRFIDWSTQGYVALVGLLIVLFHNASVPQWPWLVAAHAVCLAGVHSLVRLHAAGRGGAVIRFLRAYYPILLYTGFYRETGALNQMFVSTYQDLVFLRLDDALFGFQPSLVWMERWPHRWVAEVFYACYFSYYFMIAGVGLALLLRNRVQFDHFVSVISFVFYTCYLTYIFLPVMGPRIFFGEQASLFFGAGPGAALPAEVMPVPPPVFPASVQESWFYQIVIWIYHHFEAAGAAFPSSHVAIALATLYFTWLYLPRLRWLHSLLAAGLCLSTVYCRYHYAVDVFAGMAMTAVMLPLGQYLYRRSEARGLGRAGAMSAPEMGSATARE